MPNIPISRAAAGLTNINGTVSLDQAYGLAQQVPFSSLISWDASLGQNIVIACSSNTNFTLAFPTGVTAGMKGIITITQWTTGGQIISWTSGYRGIGGVMPVLSTAASATDEIEWYSPDGVNCDLILHANFIDAIGPDGSLDFTTGNNSGYFPSVII